MSFFFFFFNDTATTEIYTLSLHDAPSDLGLEPAPFQSQGAQHLPLRLDQVQIGGIRGLEDELPARVKQAEQQHVRRRSEEHTSELQSRHISYAVFCLKKKTK